MPQPSFSPARRRAGLRIAVFTLALAALACQGLTTSRSPTAAPTATEWPFQVGKATAPSPSASPTPAENTDVSAFSGTPIVLDLPEVTPHPDFTATGVLRWPLPITGVLKQIYSVQHRGIDIAAPPGTPVLAADSGVVVYADVAEVYGNLVVIDHGNGYQTWYGHLNAFAVKALDGVLQGQTIGYVGSTGASTGPHLHLEVRLDDRPVPPLSHLQEVPQSILEASTGSERLTATALAAATQTAAALIAAQTATARYLAGLTATAARAAELTRVAAQATLNAPSRTPSPTRSATTAAATPSPSATASFTASPGTPSVMPSLTVPPASPSPTRSASPASPSLTPSLTVSPAPPTATASLVPPSSTPTASQEPASATPSVTPTSTDTPEG